MSDIDNFYFGEKPDNVSWDSIHEVLWKAHEQNRAHGMYMLYPSLPGEKLKELIGSTGHCFVAMEGNKVVGTCSFKPINRNAWYSKGRKTAYYILDGVLPEFAGKGIHARLFNLRQSYVEKQGYDLFVMDTAEHNLPIQKIFLKNGFRYVSFKCYSSGGNYAVIIAKWLNGCPYLDWYCQLRFLLRKYYIKLRFKPGYIKRFGI
jgi:RimJ/RimL family protein N-acetyltransferase